MKLLDRNNLSELIEGVTDSVVKGINELDLFEHDGLLEALPFGKIAKFFGKKIIVIEDTSIALKKAISVAGLITFIDGLRKYGVNPIVEELFVKDNIRSLKVKIKNVALISADFDLKEFNDNFITILYKTELIHILEGLVSENIKKKISKYLSDYFKFNFLKLLEENKTIYEKIKDLLIAASYEEQIRIKKKELYRQQLKDQFHEIVLNDTTGMTLADIYIEPEYAISTNCFHEKDTRINHDKLSDKGFVSINKESVHDFTYKFFNCGLDYSLRSQSPQVLFLLGYPGQGKSSFCKKIFTDSIDGSRAVDTSFYHLKFRNITNVNELINAPLRTIEAHLNSTLEFEMSKKEFGNSILVLDGLDELSMSENFQNSTIDEFCRLLMADMDNKPNLKIVITSRYGYVNIEKLKRENILLVQLTEFDVEKQLQWLENYTQFHSETKLTKQKLEQIHESKTSKYLQELIGQPILLHLIATLNEEIHLDVNRAKIYDNLFTQLIERSWDKGQIANLKGIQQHDLREFIRSIAFEIYLSGKEYIHKSALINLPATKEFIEKLDHTLFKTC